MPGIAEVDNSPLGLSSCVTSDTKIEDSGRTLAVLNTRKRLRNMARQIPEVCHSLSERPPQDGFRYQCVMVTCTYRERGVDAWSPYHITDLGKCIDAWAARRGIKISMAWVHELQKDGTPHYHLTLYIPKMYQFPKPDKQGWWPHGMTRVDYGVRHAGRYMAKYLSKISSKDGFSGHCYPKGARIFGFRSLPDHAYRVKKFYGLPFWLRDRVPHGHVCERRFGKWWYDKDGDCSYMSPWETAERDDGGRLFMECGLEQHFFLWGDVDDYFEPYTTRRGQKSLRMNATLFKLEKARQDYVRAGHFERIIQIGRA